MYNECNQHESCAAGWNSNSCSVQPRQPSHEFYNVTAKGRSKVSKVRTRRRTRRVHEPSQGQEPIKEHSVSVPFNENALAPVSATVLLSEPNEYLNSLERINAPRVFPRKNLKRPVGEFVVDQNDDRTNCHQKPPPDPSARMSSDSRRHGIFPSVKTTGLESTSNSNSFGFFITAGDETETENQPTISSRIHSGLVRPTSYIHVKNMNKPCDIYGTEYIPQRRSASAIEKKSPPIRTRYVTELKLNLRKGRAQRVSRNWPPGLMEQDSQSDDHGEHTDPEDVQVKAILCRASSSTDNQDQITTGCVSQIGRDVIQFVTPTAKSKGNKREKVDSKLGLLNSGNSAEFVEDYQKTVNECAVERETGRESKRSVNTPGQMGPLTFSTESKRTSDTQTSVQDEQRLGASSTQTAAQTNVSPGSFSISSLRQGLQMSHSETQASPTTLKKEIDWPNYSVKNTEFNKFMQEMALNNIHSVLSEANRELCFDEPSVTSACTLIRSSVAEEPSMHTLAECVSTTTVISPMAGKTSRGTQSEQLEQVKAVRDMEIQTGLAEIPEELSQDISLNEVETDKKFTTNRINSPFPLNRDVPITSRLPLPTNGLIQGKWTQDVNRDSNDLTLGNRHTMEQDRFVSPSPSSYLILPPVQNFARNSDSPSLAASASDSGRYWHNPINLTGATAAGLTPIPDQITPPRKSLYRLVRENISSVSNKTQRPIVHASKLPHLATAIPGLEFRSEVNQPNRDFVKDLCQDETGNRECYGVVYQDESQTNQLRPERESYKSMENMQPSSTQKTGFLSPSQHNKDVVFVERSSSQNSSLDSTRVRPCVDQFYLAQGKQTSGPFSMNRIQEATGKPYMNTAGDQTTETYGCCPDGTCDCPTSTTVTGSQACTCGCCHGSGTGASEDMIKKVHVYSPRILRQTAGDEGSFRDLKKHDLRLGHVCDIVSEPSYEVGMTTMKKSNLGQNSSQCSCCSESTLTEVMPHRKTIQEHEVREPFRTAVVTSNKAPTQSGNHPEINEFCTKSTPWVSKIPPDPYNRNSALFDRNEIRRPGLVLVPPRRETNLVNKQTESTSGVNKVQTRDTQMEIANPNQTSFIPMALNRLQTQPNLSDFKKMPERPTELVQDTQDEKYPNDDAKIFKPTSPYIDTLFNLVGQKEKRSILQRWLLEQVAFSTKRKSAMESKTQENSGVVGAEAQREDEDEEEEEEDSDSSGNATESDSLCSCSVCREAAEAQVPEESSESLEGSHAEYSHYTDSLTSDPQSNQKPTTLARGRSRIPVKCVQTDYDQNYMRIKLNSRHQTSGDSMEPQTGRNGGKTFSERPMRSNSEGSLGQFDARPDYATYQKQMRRSSGWRPSEPRRSVSPSAPVPPCVTTTQLSRNAQDQEIDRNAWNTSLQRQLFSPARTDLRETASRAHETSTGSRLGGRATHNVAPSRNYRLVSHGRTIPTVRDTSDRKRMASRISSGKPNSLFPHDPRMEGRNDKSKQTTDRSRMGIKMISSDHSAVRSRFGSLTVPRTISGTEQNEFEVERVFELNQYDDLVKSHLNAADRRIKAVALKNGCRIRITGPFTKPDTSLCGAANRGKTLYNCHIAGPSEDRIGKCVNFLKETFPNSFLRTNWRV